MDARSCGVGAEDFEGMVKAFKILCSLERKGKLTKLSTIDRMFRLVQSDIEELRGKDYYKNRGLIEPEVRKEIVNFQPFQGTLF